MGKLRPPRCTVKCSDITPAKIAWLWPGRIPLGKLTLLAGDPSCGKSLLTIDMCARLSTGRPFPGAPQYHYKPRASLMISAEDDLADTVVPRLKAAGAKLRHVRAWNTERNQQGQFTPFSLNNVPQLERALREIPGVVLVTIDPVSAFMGEADSHNNTDVRSLLAPLADLAQRHKVALVMVTHTNKSNAGKAMYRAMGSLAYIAAARAGFMVIRDPKDPEHVGFLPIKNNLASASPPLGYRVGAQEVKDLGKQPIIGWDIAPIEGNVDDWLRESEAARTPEGPTTAWLREQLEGGEEKASVIFERAKSAGLSVASVRRAKDDLHVRAERRGGAGGDGYWVWRLRGDQE